MWSLSHPFPKQWESLLYLKQTGWDLQKFSFNFNHNLFPTHTQLLVGYQELLWNVLSHVFNWGLSLWVGLFHCLFPPIFPFFRIFWLLMFSLEATSLNFYKNKEIWWWEKKASFWLSLDHPFVDSWRSDISLSIPSCSVFLQHLTSFKASPLTSIDTDGREGERSCREGKSFWYQALISLVFIVKSLTISLTLNFFQVPYIQQRTGLFCFVSQIWLLILPEFFFFFSCGKRFLNISK